MCMCIVHVHVHMHREVGPQPYGGQRQPAARASGVGVVHRVLPLRLWLQAAMPTPTGGTALRLQAALPAVRPPLPRRCIGRIVGKCVSPVHKRCNTWCLHGAHAVRLRGELRPEGDT